MKLLVDKRTSYDHIKALRAGEKGIWYTYGRGGLEDIHHIQLKLYSVEIKNFEQDPVDLLDMFDIVKKVL